MLNISIEHKINSTQFIFLVQVVMFFPVLVDYFLYLFLTGFRLCLAH